MGVLQGLTEFLPVSSSGHIEIAREVLGVEVESGLRFTMMLHAGTVLSTLVVFWREILKLFKDWAGVANLVVSALPVAFIGLMFREQIEGLFTGNLLLVGCMLLVTAGLLWWSSRRKAGDKPITPQRSFIVGLAQAAAVLPGLSRSGATISAGLLQGVDRAVVARFSFLMALIPIVGELVLDAGELRAGFDTPMLVGFLAAFVSGLAACRWMVRLVSRGRLTWFAVYCAVVGVATLIIHHS